MQANMETTNSKSIYTEEEAMLPNEGSLVVAGIFGDTDIAAKADQVARSEAFKKRTKFQEFVPCFACSNCLEFRKFIPTGEVVTIGFHCLLGEFVTSCYGTCTYGHLRKDGRRRVVYDKTNAPPGFEEGLVPVTMKRFYTKKDKFRAAAHEERAGYRGGSSSYQRKDGDLEAVGTGKIPKGLGN